jgi:acylphosphatase
MPARAAYRLLVVRYRVLISGRVQGVFFRDTCHRLAERSGVAGWVRNLPDGRVEAVFEGPDEDVRRLVAWAHSGPRLAEVRDSPRSRSSSKTPPRPVRAPRSRL